MAEATQAFDLQNGPLLSLRLLRLAAQEHVLLLTLHHIIADGWSMNILIDEFMRTYDALVAGREPTLAPLTVHYRDYALWQRSWLEAARNWATNIPCWNCPLTALIRRKPAIKAHVWKR
jgi:NRPS condensation-like uncharacterized protein